VRGIEVTSTALYNVTTEEGKGKRNGLDKKGIVKGSEWLKTYGWGKKLLAPWDRFLSRGVSEEAFTEDHTRFLINVEDESCEVGVVRDSALVYARCFGLSRRSGEAGADEEVEKQADKILSEIETTRLSLTDDTSEISQLIVSGNGADQPLIDRLKENENINAQLLEELTIRINVDDAREKIPCLSAAAGLALKGLRGVPLDVNFIPRELRPKKKKNWKLICGVSAMVLLLLGMSSCTISFFVKERMYLSGLSGRVDALKERVKVIEQMQEEIAVIESKMESLEKVKADDISKLDILKELTEIIPDEMWLTRFSYVERKGKKEIELSGYADTASEIIPILEESKLFENVKFKSSIVKDVKSNKERLNVTAVVSGK
jgi:Tfp pilus assembly protein PilN